MAVSWCTHHTHTQAHMAAWNVLYDVRPYWMKMARITFVYVYEFRHVKLILVLHVFACRRTSANQSLASTTRCDANCDAMRCNALTHERQPLNIQETWLLRLLLAANAEIESIIKNASSKNALHMPLITGHHPAKIVPAVCDDEIRMYAWHHFQILRIY